MRSMLVLLVFLIGCGCSDGRSVRDLNDAGDSSGDGQVAAYAAACAPCPRLFRTVAQMCDGGHGCAPVAYADLVVVNETLTSRDMKVLISRDGDHSIDTSRWEHSYTAAGTVCSSLPHIIAGRVGDRLEVDVSGAGSTSLVLGQKAQCAIVFTVEDSTPTVTCSNRAIWRVTQPGTCTRQD